jgi:hypothetical protein
VWRGGGGVKEGVGGNSRDGRTLNADQDLWTCRGVREGEGREVNSLEVVIVSD